MMFVAIEFTENFVLTFVWNHFLTLVIFTGSWLKCNNMKCDYSLLNCILNPNYINYNVGDRLRACIS